MILGFDIGNTNTLMGIYREEETVPHHTFLFGTQKDVTSENLGTLIEGYLDDYRAETGSTDRVSGFIFSSVAPGSFAKGMIFSPYVFRGRESERPEARPPETSRSGGRPAPGVARLRVIE